MKRAMWLICLAGTLISNAVSQAGSSLEQELTTNVQHFLEAFENKNVAYFQRTLSDDYVFVTPNGDSADKSNVLEALRTEHGAPPPPRVYETKVLVLNPDAAVVTFNVIDPGGHPRYLHVSTTWVRQDGQWKVKFEQATPNLWSLSDE
jgi:hypothetical protein